MNYITSIISQSGDSFRQYLNAQGRFDRYSVANAILVSAQMPEATQLKEYSNFDPTAESFTDRFAKYKEFGIEYVEAEDASGAGNIYYNGNLVNNFLDISPNGGTFSFHSADGGKINVQTIYENEKVVGVEEVK